MMGQWEVIQKKAQPFSELISMRPCSITPVRFYEEHARLWAEKAGVASRDAL